VRLVRRISGARLGWELQGLAHLRAALGPAMVPAVPTDSGNLFWLARRIGLAFHLPYDPA
jgi:hypothetical protein